MGYKTFSKPRRVSNGRHIRCNSELLNADKIEIFFKWDSPLVSKKLDGVLSAAHIQAGHARLIAATALHSWRHSERVIGTRIDDTSLRLDLYRSSAPSCAPHTHVCGVQVGGDGTQGQGRKSSGRQMRHNAVNDLIKRALVSANVPSLLESNSLCCDDGKTVSLQMA